MVWGLAKPRPSDRSHETVWVLKGHWVRTSVNMRFQLKNLTLLSSEYTKAKLHTVTGHHIPDTMNGFWENKSLETGRWGLNLPMQ